MNWNEVLQFVYTMVLFPLITIGGIYLICFFSTKIKEMKDKTNSELAHKYLDMLDGTITNTVLATTQTYVEALKKEGKFDADAQKVAFQKTYDAVMAVLTEEAKKYITTAVGDIEIYVTNKIESEVALNKVY